MTDHKTLDRLQELAKDVVNCGQHTANVDIRFLLPGGPVDILRVENERLKQLIVHMWVHDGYERNGYRQMTSEQKELYEALTHKGERGTEMSDRQLWAVIFLWIAVCGLGLMGWVVIFA